MPREENGAEGCDENGDRDNVGDTQIWYSEECKQSTSFAPREFRGETPLKLKVRDEGVYDVQVCESLCDDLLCCKGLFGLRMRWQVFD